MQGAPPQALRGAMPLGQRSSLARRLPSEAGPGGGATELAARLAARSQTLRSSNGSRIRWIRGMRCGCASRHPAPPPGPASEAPAPLCGLAPRSTWRDAGCTAWSEGVGRAATPACPKGQGA